ncbi:MAG TPA: hypothetical protein VMF69_24720 [Gemmataceae bacterium]|nr:hypothetical protein [Gemmataceae bacterium]
MHYDFITIPDADVPQAVDLTFQHILQTYASETNKTASVWKAVPDDLLDFKPHDKTKSIRTILVQQLLSERRFFAQFVGTEEPPVDELLPPDEKPVVSAATINRCRLTVGWRSCPKRTFVLGRKHGNDPRTRTKNDAW